jgi:hypothetical protein
MECPFCVETIRDEALVCKNCTRDLSLVRPVIFEIQEIIAELDVLQRELNRAHARLAMVETPGRFLLVNATAFVLLPSILLVAAHFFVTVAFDISPIYLRIASVLIPLPFGFMTAIAKNVGFRSAIAFGIATAAVCIPCMLAVTAYVDGVDVLPSNWREWREALEYGSSIALAFGAGNLLAMLIFQVLPRTISAKGKPNAAAYKFARLLGEHVGEQALRRRARLIQDVLRTVGPLIGFFATAAGSIYTGLKGFLTQ